MDNLSNNLNQIASHPLQTKAWGEFRREWGNEIVETDYGIIIVNRLPRGLGVGTFIKGPMPTPAMLAKLKKLGQERKLIFIKIEPDYVIKKGGITCADEKKIIRELREANAVPGKTLFTPTTFWIDLTGDEEELMRSFHSKTRYNIRYAQRKGVRIMEDNSDKAFGTYLRLMRQTVKRQRFFAHNEAYHQLMWQHLQPTGIAHLLLAKHQKKVLTAWIVFVWKDFLYYPYGASSSEKQNLQANSLMLWEAIRFGKGLNLKTFDLWGREEGKGFTRFKEGFNPQIVEFLGTWDLVINKPAYQLYKGLDFTRWLALRTKAKFKKPDF